MPASHDYAGIAANADVNTVDGWRFDSYDACRRFADTHNYEGFDLHIASNVRLRFRSDAEPYSYYAIVLYDTEIVRYYPDGTFSVDNGGFNTPTSARRVTQFTPDGYAAHHNRKAMVINGHKTGHEHRFPCAARTNR